MAEKQLTPKELYDQELAAKKAAIEAKILADTAAGFLNPWDEGVSYKHFLDAIPAGKTVREYLTSKLPEDKEKDLITWIEKDLSFYGPYQEFVKKAAEFKNTKK